MTAVELPPLPERMRGRPYARGYPIPYVQFISTDGQVDFRVVDDDKVNHCLRTRRCGLCGQPMGRHVHFLGGPLCVQNGVFYDPPMHKDCADFAVQCCPHLARSKGKYRAVEPGLAHKLGAAHIGVGQMITEKKSEWFAVMHTTAFTWRREPGPSRMTIIRAKLPWLGVERWQDGVKLA